MTIEQKLKEIRALANHATKNWKFIESERTSGYLIENLKTVCEGCVGDAEIYYDGDAEFIAQSRTLIPLLVEAMEIAIEALEQIKRSDYVNEFEDGVLVQSLYSDGMASRALSKIERILNDRPI